MLNKEDNELLTRVGPGTPMGEMMREYWFPVVRSAKLDSNGAPERVRLLGENSSHGSADRSSTAAANSWAQPT